MIDKLFISFELTTFYETSIQWDLQEIYLKNRFICILGSQPSYIFAFLGSFYHHSIWCMVFSWDFSISYFPVSQFFRSSAGLSPTFMSSPLPLLDLNCLYHVICLAYYNSPWISKRFLPKS